MRIILKGSEKEMTPAEGVLMETLLSLTPFSKETIQEALVSGFEGNGWSIESYEDADDGEIVYDINVDPEVATNIIKVAGKIVRNPAAKMAVKATINTVKRSAR